MKIGYTPKDDSYAEHDKALGFGVPYFQTKPFHSGLL